jgi:hypothetical protein
MERYIPYLLHYSCEEKTSINYYRVIVIRTRQFLNPNEAPNQPGSNPVLIYNIMYY